MDVERGLERIECEIMHFHRSDETEVTSAAAIARRLARQFTLIIPFLADAEVSGEYICRSCDYHVIITMVYCKCSVM